MKITAKLFKHGKRWKALTLLSIDLLFFGLTNPGSVTSPLLISGFLLLSANLFFAVYVGLQLAAKAGFHVGSSHRKAGMSAAGVVAMLVALQSIGQLSPRDIAVVIPFALLAYMYVSYGQTAQEP